MSFLKIVGKVSFFTGCSRILGLIREMLMSYYLGASGVSDAFLVAFKFPNFFRRFFAEGAFHAAFVPEFSSHLNDVSRARSLFINTNMIMGLVLMILIAIVELFPSFFMDLIAPGFRVHGVERFELALHLTKITFPYILLISWSAILTGVLNSIGVFGAPAAAPMILNICMIVALYVFKNPYALSWSVIVAGLIHWLFLFDLVQKTTFRLKFCIPKLSSDVKNVLKRMGPGMISAGITQINMLIDMTFASFLSAGALSYIYYADRLNQLPLSMFGIAISTVILPFLAKAIAQNNDKSAKKLQNMSLSISLCLSVPASVGLIYFGFDIIGLIYGRGVFSHNDVIQTSYALKVLSAGLPAYVLLKVCNNYFFSRKDTKTPMYFSLMAIVFHIVLNFFLMRSLGHIALCLSTVLSSWAQVGLSLYILSRRNYLLLEKKQICIDCFRTCAGSCAMIFVMHHLACHFLFKIIVGIFVYALFHLHLLKLYKEH